MDFDEIWTDAEDFRNLPFEEDIELTVSGFRWKTTEGDILTIGEMNTAHIFNSMKMCFNHLAREFGGTTVEFNHIYWDYREMAQDEPELLAAIVLFFIKEIERRKDLPDKHEQPYRKIIKQIRGRGLTQLRVLFKIAKDYLG